MPSPNPTTRREYKGAAAGTTLQNSMTSSDTTFVLVAANNWPTGGVGKFIVTINRGQADEEKILCDSQSSRNVSCLLANRGFDGTNAQSHAAGATVECTISAFDADEWNAHTAASTGVHGVAGSLAGTASPSFTGTVSVTNAAAAASVSIAGTGGNDSIELGRTDGTTSTPFIDFHSGATAVDNDFRLIASGGDGTATGGVLKAQGGTFGIEGGRAGAVPFYVRQAGSPSVDIAQFQNTGGTPLVKIDNAGNISATNLTSAWTAYTPTITGVPGTLRYARYTQLGKRVTVQVYFQVSGAGTGTIGVTLPVAVSTIDFNYASWPVAVGSVSAYNGAYTTGAVVFGNSALTLNFTGPSTSSVWNATTPFTWSNANQFGFTATYESV